MTRQFSYELPKICAKCCEREGTQSYFISREKVSSYVIVRKIATTKFKVSVCDQCMAVITKMRRIKPRIRNASVLFGVVAGIVIALIVGSNPEHLMDNFLTVTLLGGSAGYIVGIFVSEVITNNELAVGGFDGRFFHFVKDEYHNQFAELNPDLAIKRK